MADTDQLAHELSNLKTRIDDLVTDIDNGERPSSDPELSELLGKAEDVSRKLTRADGDADIRRRIEQLGSLGSDESVSGTGDTSNAAVARKSWPGTAAKAIQRHVQGKALPPTGSVVTAVPAPAIVEAGRPAPNLLSLIPTAPTTSTVIPFFRQTERTNRAAPVPSGTVKPTSAFGITGDQVVVEVIAHLSEPIDRFALADSAALEQFLRTEMLYGLDVALEAFIIDGTEGLLTTPGTQTQAFAVDAPTSVRKAMTALANQGLDATGVVLNPNDWETIELALTSTEATTATGVGPLPIESATRRLWGTPVVLSVALDPGTAIVADFRGSTQLWQRDQAQIDWSEGGDLFSKNQVQWRAELRAAFAVLRPLGVVEVAVTGTP